ncbi:hypothetical protein EJB05_09535, partial [Eragrostis curvula]
MAGALAMAFGGSYAALMAVRFVTSLGSRFARVVEPVYNAEICRSPRAASCTPCLALINCSMCIFINVGSLLRYVSNHAFAGIPVHLGWRVMYAVRGRAPPPIVLAAAVSRDAPAPRRVSRRAPARLGHRSVGRPSAGKLPQKLHTPATAASGASAASEAEAEEKGDIAWRSGRARRPWRLLTSHASSRSKAAPRLSMRPVLKAKFEAFKVQTLCKVPGPNTAHARAHTARTTSTQ